MQLKYVLHTYLIFCLSNTTEQYKLSYGDGECKIDVEMMANIFLPGNGMMNLFYISSSKCFPILKEK